MSNPSHIESHLKLSKNLPNAQSKRNIEAAIEYQKPIITHAYTLRWKKRAILPPPSNERSRYYNIYI